MKHVIKIIAILLCFATVLTLMAGCKKKEAVSYVSFEDEYTLTPLNASYRNMNVFANNPDRGFRVHNVVKVEDIVDLVGNEQAIQTKLSKIFGDYTDRIKEPYSISFMYIYLTKWHLEELPEEALEAVRAIFRYAEARKLRFNVTFCYNDNAPLDWRTSEENKKLQQSKSADQETILKHIDQLAPIVSEYKHCCYNIKNGFIGTYGEWAYPYQYPEVDYDVITKAIVDKLCIPNGLYFSHRMPEYTESVKKRYPDWDGWKYIGWNNCAFCGEQKNGWGSGGFELDDKAGWWDYVSEHAAYAPNGGELYPTNIHDERGWNVGGKEAILELAHHRFAYFSFFHGRYDVEPGRLNIMDNWEHQEITKDWLDSKGIIYDPNWFLDANGNTVSRNCYEFIRDHLGYKVVAENVKLNAADGKIKVDMSLKNYGFAAAFNMTSGFAILNEKYEVVSEIEAGDPDTWYSHDPENWKSTTVLTHNVSGELEAPTASGTYHIAFFLKNPHGVGAQLSNDVQFEKEYNILYTFEV